MLKAIVRVIGYVDGERIEFLPGTEVVGLHPHDQKELLENGAIEDTDLTARQERRDAATEKAAAADFEKARTAVQAAAESRAATGTEEQSAPTKPSGKKK